MTEGLGSVLALALSGFALLWAFGAYNRLVQERARAIRALAQVGRAVEERAAVLLAVSHAQLLHAADSGNQALWHRMESCLQQTANAVAHAEAKPLQADRVAALGAALSALDESMLAVQSYSQALVGAPWPMELQTQLARCDARLLTQTENFNAAVDVYCESLSQFPTWLVAKLFGMTASQRLVHAAPTGLQSKSPSVDENTLLTVRADT